MNIYRYHFPVEGHTLDMFHVGQAVITPTWDRVCIGFVRKIGHRYVTVEKIRPDGRCSKVAYHPGWFCPADRLD